MATGSLIGAIDRGTSLTGPLTFVGIVFVASQVLSPVQEVVSANLGNRTASWLNDRLMEACTTPEGIAHLERGDLIDDLTVARDFDLGQAGPPLSISMGFIAGGLQMIAVGLAAAIVLFGFSWWAPLVLLAAWSSTHWLLRESGVWRDRNTDEVRNAQRHADYAYRLAVDPPAAKEVRLFGLADWVIDRFGGHRRRLYELQWEATRLRERSVLACLLIVLAANAFVLWVIGEQTIDGRLDLADASVYLQTAVGVGAIAFGGLSWALDGSAAPVVAVLRLEAAMAEAGALPRGAMPATGLPVREIRFRDVHFTYPGTDRPILDGFDLTIPAGSSLAIVGQNGAGKTTLAKLLCRLYDPQSGAIEVDGTDLRELDLEAWRAGVAAVFQDFVRFERSLRSNVAPGRDPSAQVDAEVEAALADAGARQPRRTRRGAVPGLRRRHRSLGRSVATDRPRAGAGEGAARGPSGPARRADRPAGCPGRVRDLRARPRGDARVHHDPRVPQVLDRAAGRPHLRGRARWGRRDRQPRGADGPRRPLPHHVRHAGVALRRDRRGRRGGGA